MKESLRCPKCDGARVWIIDRVLQPDHDSTNGVRPLHLVAKYYGLWKGREEVGTFQAFLCDACGYTEWYARDLEGLAQLAKDPEAGVRLVSSEASETGPFR